MGLNKLSSQVDALITYYKRIFCLIKTSRTPQNILDYFLGMAPSFKKTLLLAGGQRENAVYEPWGTDSDPAKTRGPDGQCCGSGSVLDLYSGALWIRIRIPNTDPHISLSDILFL